MSTLDELLERVQGKPLAEQLAIVRESELQTRRMKWVPNPGPQTDAYFSLADVLLYGGEPGGGKLLKLDTPIPTPYGWSTIGELRVGDQVFDECGNVCNVVAKSAIEREATYQLTFSDGSQIVAGERHQWVTSAYRERMRVWQSSDERRTIRRENRPTRGSGKRLDLAARNTLWAKPLDLPLSGIRTTGEIARTLMRGERLNHSVAVAGCLQLSEAVLLIEPYVLGAWLGDGSTGSGDLTGIDEEIFQQVANAGYTVSQRARPITRGILGLKVQLRSVGVLGNKHIPPAYLRASPDQRLALLQGLMDTDGYCDSRGQCEFTTIKRVLADGMRELLSSLGIKVAVTEGVATLNGRAIGPKYRLKFLTELPAFRLARKLLRQKRAGFRGTHATRYIERCDPVDPVDMQCIQVDSASRCYLCGWTMIPTHNSQLILGLAFNEHQQSLIMRREYGDLDGLTADALKIHGTRDGYNGSPPPKLRINQHQHISFAAAHRIGDEQGQMGKGRDLIGVDEATHFAKSQIRFIMGWNRTADPAQRCRVVLATNPPLSPEGMWVIDMFAPWLDPQYPNPAKPGELRWVISDDDGNDRWVDGPGRYEVLVAGTTKMVQATSRTYIPASVKDNPYYVASGYETQLDAMPEPYRSLLMGGFKTAFRDAPGQIIPTAWVQEAQKRWTPQPPRGVPMCAIGVDCSGGGDDPMVLAPRYDGWYAPLVEVPGKDIPMDRSGSFCAGVVVSHRRDGALVVVDMGGGYGGPLHEHLKANEVETKGYKGAEATTRRGGEGKLKFVNKRTAALWLFREALDPGQPGGSPIALPPDPRAVADLTAPTFKVTPQGIKAEPKEDVCERLGRSTDRGDAIVMSWLEGPRMLTDALDWMGRTTINGRLARVPQIITGGRQPLTAGRQPMTGRR